MYYITYQAKPRPSVENFNKIGGAYINCYILHDDFKGADEMARQDIDEMDWDIVEMEYSNIVDPTALDKEAKGYYERALEEEMVFVFHIFPR